MIVPEELDQWREAARIASRARSLGASLVAPGVSRREVAERVEEFIRAAGAAPAFPANLSRDTEAAHYTPDPEDAERFAAGELVKVDVGAHLDGAIADTAVTVEVGGGRSHEGLRRASAEAVEAAIALVRPGVAVDDLSRAIEATIHRRGFKPVRDLTGHSIERYLLHAGKSIPNASGQSTAHLAAGEVIAIEPFATNGQGSIGNGPFGNIVRFRTDPSAAGLTAAGMFARFRTLPFTARWLTPAERRELLGLRRFLQTYPVFVERGAGLVSQAEHTVLVTDEGAEVLTR